MFGSIGFDRELDAGGLIARHRLILVAPIVAREPEVHDQDLGVAGPDHRVVGLEVAMHDALGVGRREPTASGQERGQHLLAGPRALALPGRQRDALDQLHHDVVEGLVRADLVDPDHVGVGELGQGLGLAQQPHALERAARAQDLDRDLAIEGLVVGGIDHAHASATERRQQYVAAQGHGALAEIERILALARVFHHAGRGRPKRMVNRTGADVATSGARP